MYLQKIESKNGNYHYVGCTDEEFQCMDLDLMRALLDKEDCSVFTIAYFNQMCDDGLFNSLDGDCLFASTLGVTNRSAWDKSLNDADMRGLLYVCWFDKGVK